MNILRRLTLRAKLFLIVAVGALSVLFVGTASFVTSQKTIKQYRQIALKNLPTSLVATNMRGIAKDIRAMVFRLGLAKNSEELESTVTRIENLLSQYEEAESEYLALSFIEGEKALYDVHKKNWDQWVTSIKSAVEARKNEAQPDMQGYFTVLSGPFRENANAYLESINELVTFHQSQARLSRENAEKTEKIGFYTSLFFICIGFAFSMTVGFLYGRNLSRALLRMSQRLQDGAAIMNEAAGTVAGMSEDLARGVQEQASALQETSSAVEEITATAAKNVGSAQQSRRSARASQENVEDGKQAIESLVSGLDNLKAGNESLIGMVVDNTSKMRSLVDIIKEIDTKTKVINDIVFQTKLLSFNASVEAARAGEAGKGFSVVAEEIGNLARMSGTASRDISSLLQTSMERVDQIVSESKSSSDSILKSSSERYASLLERVKVCESTFSKIYSSNLAVVNDMEQIGQASQEQNKGMQEISKAISQLDATTQESAVSSSKASSAAASLASEVESLKEVIQDLLITVSGQNAQAKSRERADVVAKIVEVPESEVVSDSRNVA